MQFKLTTLRHLVLFALLNNGPRRRPQPLCGRTHSFVGLRVDCRRELIHSSTEVGEVNCLILTPCFLGNFEKSIVNINKFFRPLPFPSLLRPFVNAGIVHNDVSETGEFLQKASDSRYLESCN